MLGALWGCPRPQPRAVLGEAAAWAGGETLRLDAGPQQPREVVLVVRGQLVVRPFDLQTCWMERHWLPALLPAEGEFFEASFAQRRELLNAPSCCQGPQTLMQRDQQQGMILILGLSRACAPFARRPLSMGRVAKAPH